MNAPSPFGGDFGRGKRRHLFGHLDIRNLLDVAPCENDIDLLEGPSSRLGVEKVDGLNGQRERDKVSDVRCKMSRKSTHRQEAEAVVRTQG